MSTIVSQQTVLKNQKTPKVTIFNFCNFSELSVAFCARSDKRMAGLLQEKMRFTSAD